MAPNAADLREDDEILELEETALTVLLNEVVSVQNNMSFARSPINGITPKTGPRTGAENFHKPA